MIRDTTPDAVAAQWRALSALSSEQRLRQALELTDFVLHLQAAGRQSLGENEERPTSTDPERTDR